MTHEPAALAIGNIAQKQHVPRKLILEALAVGDLVQIARHDEERIGVALRRPDHPWQVLVRGQTA